MTKIAEILSQIDELNANIDINRSELIERLEQLCSLLNKTIAKEIAKTLNVECKFKVDYDPETLKPELALYIPVDIDIRDISNATEIKDRIYEQTSEYLAKHYKELSSHVNIDINEIIHVRSL